MAQVPKSSVAVQVESRHTLLLVKEDGGTLTLKVVARSEGNQELVHAIIAGVTPEQVVNLVAQAGLALGGSRVPVVGELKATLAHPHWPT